MRKKKSYEISSSFSPISQNGNPRDCSLLNLKQHSRLLSGKCGYCHILFNISCSDYWEEGRRRLFFLSLSLSFILFFFFFLRANFLRAEPSVEPQRRNVMMKESYCSKSSGATWIAGWNRACYCSPAPS